MTQQLKIFNFENQPIRMQIIEGKEYFCAIDICKILQYANGRDAINDNCRKDGVASSYITDNLGRTQQATFINEPNLYRLIVKSKMPRAQEFEKWVFEEVLPSIRKTGKYQIDNPYAIASKKDLLKMALEQEERIEALEIESKQKDIMIEEHIKSERDLTFRDTAKELNLKPNKFCEKLREQRYIMSNNEAYQRYIDANIFCCKFIKDSKTGISYARYYITPKGFEYFAKKKEQGCYNDIKN